MRALLVLAVSASAFTPSVPPWHAALTVHRANSGTSADRPKVNSFNELGPLSPWEEYRMSRPDLFPDEAAPEATAASASSTFEEYKQSRPDLFPDATAAPAAPPIDAAAAVQAYRVVWDIGQGEFSKVQTSVEKEHSRDNKKPQNAEGNGIVAQEAAKTKEVDLDAQEVATAKDIRARAASRTVDMTFKALVTELIARLPSLTSEQLDLVRELEGAIVARRFELESCGDAKAPIAVATTPAGESPFAKWIRAAVTPDADPVAETANDLNDIVAVEADPAGMALRSNVLPATGAHWRTQADAAAKKAKANIGPEPVENDSVARAQRAQRDARAQRAQEAELTRFLEDGGPVGNDQWDRKKKEWTANAIKTLLAAETEAEASDEEVEALAAALPASMASDDGASRPSKAAAAASRIANWVRRPEDPKPPPTSLDHEDGGDSSTHLLRGEEDPLMMAIASEENDGIEALLQRPATAAAQERYLMALKRETGLPDVSDSP